MTKKERQIIRECLPALLDLPEAKFGFTDAIGRLAEMVGMDYPAARLMKEMKQVDVRELHTEPNGAFTATCTYLEEETR